MKGRAVTDIARERLVMWDIDHTLLYAGGVSAEAYQVAFCAITGLVWQATMVTAGRTDREISEEIFGHHGIADCEPHLDEFFSRYADEFLARAHLVVERGRVLPGVPGVLDGLARRTHVTQTLVTGNIAPVAAAKVAAFGLAGAFDLEIGGYGTDGSVRAMLVRRCRERAEAKRQLRFADADVLVVGDTVHDVAGALANGVTAVGVASGGTSAAELAAAGAQVVLEDLSDVPAVIGLLAG